jgi:hypothetical protein
MTTLEEENVPRGNPGCGIIGRYPIISILVFAACGIGLGIGLSAWEPETADEANTKKEGKTSGQMTLEKGCDDDTHTYPLLVPYSPPLGRFDWRSLYPRAQGHCPSTRLYQRVHRHCVDMMSLGRASRIGWTTIGLYLLTTIAASVLGIISIVIFRSKFTSESFDEGGPSYVTLGCGVPGTFIAEGDNGALSCTSSYASEEDILFEFDNVVSASLFLASSRGEAMV